MGRPALRYDVTTLLHRLAISQDAYGEPIFDHVEVRRLASFYDLAENALRLLKGDRPCWCPTPPREGGEHGTACKTALSAMACLDG